MQIDRPAIGSASGEAASLAQLARVAACVRASAGWRQRALAFTAGALSTLAMAPFFLWPVMFATFPVLVWMIEGAGHAPRPVRAAAHAGWWFGFGYFFFGLLWIGEAFLVEAEVFAWLLPFAVTLLPAAMAVYWGLAAALARFVWSRQSAAGDGPAAALGRILLLAVALAGFEWLRGHAFTGFPWNPPGVALTWPLPLMQAAGVLGIYGLTLWAVLVFAIPAVALTSATGSTIRRAWAVVAAGAAAPLAVAYALGAWHLSAPPSAPVPGVRLRLVQPSVPQREKWMSQRQPAIFADHLDLSKRDRDGRIDDLAGITHVIWPEAAMPFGPLDHPEALAAIGQLLPPGVQLLTGALRAVRDQETGERRAYNSLMVFGADGALTALYDKIHLVPFGEYLPFGAVLERIGLQNLTRQRGGFTSGPEPKPLVAVAGLPPFAPLICYEAIFPAEAVPPGMRAGLVVVVTNDGWFGNTTGPQQHFHQTRLRAVEQGLTVVRSANNGISGVIDPEGRVLSSLALNVRGSIDSDLPSLRPLPLYARFGDWIFVLNAIGFFVLARVIRK